MRSIIDFPVVLAQLAKSFEAAGAYSEVEEEEGNNFFQYSRIMKFAISTYNQRIGNDAIAPQLSQKGRRSTRGHRHATLGWLCFP